MTDKKKGVPLNAELLSQQIIKLRAPVQQAKAFLGQKLIKKLKFIEKRNEKKADEKQSKKIEKMEEDIKAIKQLNRDDVAKFALVNVKSRDSLLQTASSSQERALFSLIFEKPIAKIVKEYRAQYDDWEVTTPYLLQRLGLQYSGNKTAKAKILALSEDPVMEADNDSVPKKPIAKKGSSENTKKNNSSSKAEKKTSVINKSDDEQEDEDDNEVSNDEDNVSNEEQNDLSDEEQADISADEQEGDDDDNVDDGDDDDDEEISDVELGTDSEDDSDKADERRRLLLELAGIKEDKARPKPVPKKRKPVESESDNDSAEEDEADEPQSNAPPKKKEKISEGKTQTSMKPADDSKENKKSSIQDILQNALKEQAPSKKKLKELRKKNKKEARDKPSRVPIPMDNQSLANLIDLSKMKSATGGVIQQVKLSDGGKLKFTSRRKKEAEEDSDEGPTTDPFFMPAGDNNSDGSGSGEESADDDKDLDVPSFNKGKSGEFRKGVGSKRLMQKKLERAGVSGQTLHLDRSSGNQKRLGSGRDKPVAKNTKGPSGLPEELHPSWAAKRLKKEQNTAVPQGKRTVFGDDD